MMKAQKKAHFGSWSRKCCRDPGYLEVPQRLRRNAGQADTRIIVIVKLPAAVVSVGHSPEWKLVAITQEKSRLWQAPTEWSELKGHSLGRRVKEGLEAPIFYL